MMTHDTMIQNMMTHDMMTQNMMTHDRMTHDMMTYDMVTYFMVEISLTFIIRDDMQKCRTCYLKMFGLG